jgi:hypothetical protein
VRASAGQLGAEHVDAFDRRRLRQQLGRVRPQRLRDRPVEVSLTASFIGEGIEDAEGGRTELQSEPHRGGAFLLRQAEAGLQELGNFLLFAGFGFETDKQRMLDDG